MVRMTQQWTHLLADQGNEPGFQVGDVLVELTAPVGGVQSFTCPSGDLTAAAEAGQVIGLSAMVGGRRLFVPWANVAGIIDAPVSDAKLTADRA